jgi:pantetheine-phosphate adenylyltransferase
MRVCVGGTFDYLHKGHRSLLQKAFEISGKNGHVYIGVSCGNLVKSKNDVKPLDIRIKNLEKYLEEKGFPKRFTIIPIEDKYGITLDEDFDAIIVSPETISIAEEINKIRIDKAKKPMEIIEIPFVLDENGKPISSTRIKNKEIDEDGRVFSSE